MQQGQWLENYYSVTNLIKIKVIGWSENQLNLSKTNRRPVPFFKVYTSFYNDPRFHKNGPLRLTYLYLFYLVASIGDDTVLVDVALASDCAGVTRKEFTLCLDVLVEQGRIQKTDEMEMREDIYVRSESNDSQEKSGEKAIFKEKVSAFLDSVYEAYPKGRQSRPTEGKQRLAKDMKTEQDMVDLGDALNNYLTHIDINNIEVQFVKNFKTFCNQWKDWISKESVQDLSKPVFEKNKSRYV